MIGGIFNHMGNVCRDWFDVWSTLHLWRNFLPEVFPKNIVLTLHDVIFLVRLQQGKFEIDHS